MARYGVPHEDHINHEAWAIPYADLVTLLLAFFVVMYSISSVNEGKFRVVSKSISTAFNGASKVIEPMPVSAGPGASRTPSVLLAPPSAPSSEPIVTPAAAPPQADDSTPAKPLQAATTSSSADDLASLADSVESSIAALIDRGVVVVRRHQRWIEVEIRADILFPSGTAALTTSALEPLHELAQTLAGFRNPLHIEGHTDDVPISTPEFPSNWELSAARAARVARLFIETGIDAHRLSISGLGEFRPIASNDTEEGRNRNRRVRLIVLDDGSAAIPDELRANVPPAPGSDVEAKPAIATNSETGGVHLGL
jgi:chemotaxis protein MotB